MATVFYLILGASIFIIGQLVAQESSTSAAPHDLVTEASLQPVQGADVTGNESQSDPALSPPVVNQTETQDTKNGTKLPGALATKAPIITKSETKQSVPNSTKPPTIPQKETTKPATTAPPSKPRPQPQHSWQTKRIVVIGAGIAGLSAANVLINTCNFVNVTILESQNWIGGRVYSEKHGDEFLELGARYLYGTGVSRDLFDIAKSVGALASEEEHKKFREKTPKCYSFDGSDVTAMFKSWEDPMYLLYTYMVSSGTNLSSSIGGAYSKKFEKFFKQKPLITKEKISYETMLKHVFKITELTYGLKSLNDASMRNFFAWRSEFEDKSKIRRLKIKGFQPIIDFFVEKIDKSNIRLETHVSTLAKVADGRILITMKDNKQIVADHVILTSSIGNLKKKYGGLLGQLGISDDHKQLFKTFGYGHISRLYLIYSKNFWRSDPIFFLRPSDAKQLYKEPDEEKMFYYFEPHPYVPNVLVADIAGSVDGGRLSDADIIENMSESDLKNHVTTVLKRFLKIKSIPASLDKIIRSQWNVNNGKFMQTFYGSTPYYDMKCTKNEKLCDLSILKKPITSYFNGKDVPILYFAGDATIDGLLGTVSAAATSGKLQAQQLCDFYATKN